MTDHEAIETRKAAAAAGAGDNSGAGLDGDGPSAADTEQDGPPPAADGSPDATDTTHPTGEKQAQQNEELESPA